MRRPEEAKRVLHIGIVRASAAFGYNPVDVLGRILDVARLAMNTILGIDLEAWRTFLQTDHFVDPCRTIALRSEEHTSELQSLMRISYAVFCLKKKKNKYTIPVFNTQDYTTIQTTLILH